ncbi:MAG TPA: zf-HC2 domain-containing protein [Acidobacteriota bacterium]|jgi:hypothetical protein|nr:zf-HC2 domain-containing protein [Acidobacteriota bacterium]
MTSCDNYRNQIPQALLGELTAQEQQALESHLRDCPVCRREQDLVVDTVTQIRSATDIPVPRHFFVYSQKSHATAWDLFKQFSIAWKLAVTAAVAVTAVFAGLAVANFHGRSDRGVYTFGFGKSIEPAAVPAAPGFDVQALKLELLRVLEERSGQERLQWVQAMKDELRKSESTLSRQQQKTLETALASAEGRVNNRIFTTGLALQANWNKSLSDMYQSIGTQRQRDLVLIRERLDQLAAQGQIKADQTDVILETLLQVAEVRLK